MTISVQVVGWLDAFADAVRTRDVPRGRTYFDADCRSFGTRAVAVDDLDALVAEQWTPTWMATSGFAFDHETLSVRASEDGSQMVATVQWSSDGFHGGSARARTGRSTIVLRPDPSSPEPALLAVHTHFSMNPVPADLAD